jgi:cold-inducible RNA-binding protein
LSTSLFVANLPLSTNEEILTGAFAEFGTVLSVKLKRDPLPGFTRCYGFVEMSTTAEARTAASALNATRFDGRVLSVWRAARS